MTKRIVTIISAILVLLLLASCGNSGTPSNEGASPNGGSSSSGGGTTSGGGTSSGGATTGPERSRTVSFAYGSKPQSMNPFDYNDNEAVISFNMYMQTLMMSDHAGNFSPMLATSWDIAPDATYWIFSLREDVYFHNGQHFDADDVVFSFQYLIDRRDEVAVLMLYLPQLASVEKLDQYKVKVGFSSPVIFPTAATAFTDFYIAPHSAYEEFGDDMFLVQNSYGTGPWIIQDWIDGQYTRYTKNENYWDKANYDSYFNEVYYNHSSEPSTLGAAVLSGDLNVYAPYGGVDADLLPMFDSVRDKIDVINIDTNTTRVLVMNLAPSSPFSDINFRKAFSMAIDRQLIIDQILGGGNYPHHFFHSSVPGYDTGHDAYPYDPELAKEYLAKSNYHGEEIIYMGNYNVPKPEEVALAIKDMVSKIGINMSVQIIDVGIWFERRNKGDYDVSTGQLAFSNGSTGWFYGTFIKNDLDHTTYYNADLFSQIDKYLQNLDDASRLKQVTDIIRVVEDDYAPLVPLAHLCPFYAVEKGITGVSYYPDGMMNFRFIDYDPSLVR